MASHLSAAFAVEVAAGRLGCGTGGTQPKGCDYLHCEARRRQATAAGVARRVAPPRFSLPCGSRALRA